VPVGARKAVVLWGASAASDGRPVPSEEAPWELQEWDGQRWVSHGQATTQVQVDAFFAEAAQD
jgi:hypothetical protein